MSTRERIQMTEDERLALLDSERVVVISSLGPRGWPHSMPMWFVVREGDVWIWTYGKSQKVLNLRRDPRVTLLAETGDAYQDLRGVMIEAEADLDDDPEIVLGVGRELATRYGGGEPTPEAEAALAAQAGKRVAIHFRPIRTVTWDHRKL